MKIIDPVSGKRLDNKGPKLDPSLKKTDPLKVNAEKGMEGEENSPMDPPDAYGGAVIEDVPYEALHPLLQHYMDDHVKAVEMIERFDKALAKFKEQQYRMDEETNGEFHDFFEYYDEHLLDHNRREERQLFPTLPTVRRSRVVSRRSGARAAVGAAWRRGRCTAGTGTGASARTTAAG